MDAANALEAALQQVLFLFAANAPGKAQPIHLPGDKGIAKLVLPELIEAAFKPSRGGQPLVPVVFAFSTGPQSGGQAMWSRRDAINQVVQRTRILSAHAIRATGEPNRIEKANRFERFQLIEAVAGFCAELGILSRGDVSDLEGLLGRRFEDFPKLQGSKDPVGWSTLAAQPYARLIGREQQKQKAMDMLERARQPVTIVGEGGYGKTALAWAICDSFRHREAFGAVIWVNAKREQLGLDKIEQLTGNFYPSQLALIKRVLLGLGVSRGVELEAAQDDLEAFCARTRTLVVIDNYEHLTEAAREGVGWLGNHAWLLLTSRHDVSLQAVPLEPLEENECAKMLQNEYRQRMDQMLELDHEQEKAVREKTAGNPLAVWWIAHAMAQGRSLRRCLDLLGDNSHHLLAYCYKDLVETLEPSAVQAARLLLASKGGLHVSELVELGLSQDTAESAIFELDRLNVVLKDPEDGSFAFTPLCERYLTHAWKDDAHLAVAKEELRRFEAGLSPLQVSLRWGPIRSPAASLYNFARPTNDASRLKAYVIEHPMDIWGHLYLGIILRRAGATSPGKELTEQALVQLEKARELFERATGGRPHADRAFVLREIAVTHRNLDDMAAALEHVQAAIDHGGGGFERGLQAQFLCEDSQMEKGVPQLIKVLEEDAPTMTLRNTRLLAARLASFVVRFPTGDRPDVRADLLAASLKVIEQDLEGMLDNSERRNDLATLLHAAARAANKIGRTEDERRFVALAHRLPLSGTLVRIGRKPGNGPAFRLLSFEEAFRRWEN